MPRTFLCLTLCVWLTSGACRGEADRTGERVEPEVVATPVAAEPARRGSLKAVIRTTGVVTPATGSEFIASATEPARILEIPYAEGDRVASGDLLVRFAMPSADTEASRQRAEIARAQARLDNARITQARSRELAERGIISRREMENADNEVTDAQGDLTRAESARASAEAAMARAVIRAPFGGIITQRLHNPGDLTQAIATDPILRLVDPDRLEITATITAADAPRILPGAAGRITSGTAPVRVTVASRPSAGDRGTDALVRLVFAEPATFAVDTRVEIEIEGEERVDVILVGADSLVPQGAEMAVFVAANDTAERRIVTTGLRDADVVEITSGLKAGELVITRGQVGLTDGAAISVDTFAR